MSSFSDAFRAARKAGKQTFTWNGKSYNTKYKEEVENLKITPASASPGPKPKPSASSEATSPPSSSKGSSSGQRTVSVQVRSSAASYPRLAEARPGIGGAGSSTAANARVNEPKDKPKERAFRSRDWINR